MHDFDHPFLRCKHCRKPRHASFVNDQDTDTMLDSSLKPVILIQILCLEAVIGSTRHMQGEVKWVIRWIYTFDFTFDFLLFPNTPGSGFLRSLSVINTEGFGVYRGLI